MANYLMRFKGTYRLLPELDLSTNDFCKKLDGTIEDIDIYISCRNGNKIKTYGRLDHKRPVWLSAYIPSLIRGHKIIKELDEQGIEYRDYYDTDSEVCFLFLAKDIEVVAKLMQARTSGASISPNSTRNLPKSDYVISKEEIEVYKEIIAPIPKEDILVIKQFTNNFMSEILQKKHRKLDIKADMRKKCMARQTKEYIHSMGLWKDYIKYLRNKVNQYLKEKETEE